jgi:ABC-2 type transport system permease protein
VVAEKMAALALQAAALAGVVFVAVFVAVGSGIFFELTFSTVTIAATTAAVTLMAIDFGLIAMAVGAFTGNRGFAVGVTAALAAGTAAIVRFDRHDLRA